MSNNITSQAEGPLNTREIFCLICYTQKLQSRSFESRVSAAPRSDFKPHLPTFENLKKYSFSCLIFYAVNPRLRHTGDLSTSINLTTGLHCTTFPYKEHLFTSTNDKQHSGESFFFQLPSLTRYLCSILFLSGGRLENQNPLLKKC